MDLIESLFPGLVQTENAEVPVWGDYEAPWSLLSSSPGGLISQIRDLVEEPDGVFIDPSATIGEFVRIEGPCFIGANVEIRHTAYLRQGSWICDDAVVGHATEVKNSVLLPGAKAPHFNYVGDSILGIDANLGAGTKLSNVRNDRREVLATLSDGTKINTGLSKMGAIIGDGSQLGCNVVTNPGTILEPRSMVSPNKTVTGWFGH